MKKYQSKQNLLVRDAQYVDEKSVRHHALDAMRGVMMLLGVFLHTAITYGSSDHIRVWLLRSSQNSPLFDLAVYFVHSFRMPVFFVAAGFLSALLYYRKGASVMLVNRIKRILLPFLAGTILIFPVVYFSFYFTLQKFQGDPYALTNTLNHMKTWRFLMSINTMHLWFLYYLFMYVVTAWLVGGILTMAAVHTDGFFHYCSRILKSWWLRLLVMIPVYIICLHLMGTVGIETTIEWRVHFDIFALYFLFFGTGWIIFRTDTLDDMKGGALPQLGVATLLLLMAVLVPWPKADWVFFLLQCCTAIYGSLFVYGFLALFLQHFNRYSSRMRYLIESSYWIYLVHLPIAALIPGLLSTVKAPLVIKFLVTFVGTLIITMASYHWLVRNTALEQFLNGRKSGGASKAN